MAERPITHQSQGTCGIGRWIEFRPGRRRGRTEVCVTAPTRPVLAEYRNQCKGSLRARWEQTRKQLFFIFGPFAFGVKGTDRRFIDFQFVARMFCGTEQATFILLAFFVLASRGLPVCC